MAEIEIKICCIADGAEARLAAAAGAGWLGLVGPMPSGPGILTLAAAREIAGAAPEGARPILLTASETAAQVERDAAAAGVGAVQVVRHIAPVEAAALASTPLHYVQVIHVEDAGALDLIAPYAGHADAFLLDSGRPSEAVLGGTGQAHDWSVSRAFVAASPLPVFLAGGLTPENAAEAIARVRPAGLDICSGLRPQGALDHERLTAFVAAAKGAMETLA
ncbi:MAG: phosphoribosylanthranilate isomerase [Pseudomonadota bacterium]